MTVEQIRAIVAQILPGVLGDVIVLETPEGVAILSHDGRHFLIRVDDARLEVAR